MFQIRYMLAASQTRDKDSLTEDGVERVIRELRPFFDWVICDSQRSSLMRASAAGDFALGMSASIAFALPLRATAWA